MESLIPCESYASERSAVGCIASLDLFKSSRVHIAYLALV